MLQRTCIVLISLLFSFSPLGRAMLNLTLPGQHPNPEAVAQEVHRYIYTHNNLCSETFGSVFLFLGALFFLGLLTLFSFPLDPGHFSVFLQEGKCLYGKKGNATTLPERRGSMPDRKPHWWLLEMWPGLGQQPAETCRLRHWVWPVCSRRQEWRILHSHRLLRRRRCES